MIMDDEAHIHARVVRLPVRACVSLPVRSRTPCASRSNSPYLLRRTESSTENPDDIFTRCTGSLRRDISDLLLPSFSHTFPKLKAASQDDSPVVHAGRQDSESDTHSVALATNENKSLHACADEVPPGHKRIYRVQNLACGACARNLCAHSEVITSLQSSDTNNNLCVRRSLGTAAARAQDGSTPRSGCTTSKYWILPRDPGVSTDFGCDTHSCSASALAVTHSYSGHFAHDDNDDFGTSSQSADAVSDSHGEHVVQEDEDTIDSFFEIIDAVSFTGDRKEAQEGEDTFGSFVENESSVSFSGDRKEGQEGDGPIDSFVEHEGAISFTRGTEEVLKDECLFGAVADNEGAVSFTGKAKEAMEDESPIASLAEIDGAVPLRSVKIYAQEDRHSILDEDRAKRGVETASKSFAKEERIQDLVQTPVGCLRDDKAVSLTEGIDAETGSVGSQ